MIGRGSAVRATSKVKGRSGRAVAATAMVGALTVLAACTDEGEVTSAEGTSESSSQSAAPTELTSAVPEGLETFYDQSLAWDECDGGECATLEVPIDYQAPDDGSIELALLRVAAGGDKQGSLVVNPGGPGGSGVEYAQAAPLAFSSDVREVYDVVGFDPRGVARSAPIMCFDDEQMDDFYGSDPSPDDAAEEAEADALNEEFVEACEAAAPELLGHVSTVEAARDMDVLRAALGEEDLDYLGASYGTYLGATYASLFPENVGQFVLDGALDPTLSDQEVSLGQAGGFEESTRAYVQDCIDSGDCPLGDDVDAGMQNLVDFLAEVDENPLPVSGDSVTELTEGWALLGIIVAMYDEGAWPLLTQALQSAQDGDGSSLMYLANFYADRNAEGVYSGNSGQAIYAVNCLDRPSPEGAPTAEEMQPQFDEVAPVFGKYLNGEGACGIWPETAVETIDDYSAAGAPPILVVGTTGDPATPYDWAVKLADTLDSGVLLTYEGEGHTAYGRSNSCIDDAIDGFLIDDVVPEDGLTC